jgi:hypothetical protein
VRDWWVFDVGLVTYANGPMEDRLLVMALLTVGYFLQLAIAGLFIAWRERYGKPPADGHIRAVEREKRWYPLPADTDIDRC